MKIVDPFRMGNWKRCQTHSFFASKVGGVVTRFEVTVVILFVSPVTYVFFPPVAGLSLRDLSHLKDPCVSPQFLRVGDSKRNVGRVKNYGIITEMFSV